MCWELSPFFLFHIRIYVKLKIILSKSAECISGAILAYNILYGKVFNYIFNFFNSYRVKLCISSVSVLKSIFSYHLIRLTDMKLFSVSYYLFNMCRIHNDVVFIIGILAIYIPLLSLSHTNFLRVISMLSVISKYYFSLCWSSPIIYLFSLLFNRLFFSLLFPSFHFPLV